jgi:hypothetical protein
MPGESAQRIAAEDGLTFQGEPGSGRDMGGRIWQLQNRPMNDLAPFYRQSCLPTARDKKGSQDQIL